MSSGGDPATAARFPGLDLMSVRLVPVASGKPIKLDKPVLIVGRNPDCDVVLTDSRKVSRLHCLVACVENRILVRDLGSTNGVWINNHRVDREARLTVGDELSVADVRYQLLLVDAGGEEASPEKGSNGRKREAEVKVRDGRRIRVRTVGLPDIQPGQEVPVALPEEDDSFVVEASMPRMPRVEPDEESGSNPVLNIDAGQFEPEPVLPVDLESEHEIIPLGEAPTPARPRHAAPEPPEVELPAGEDDSDDSYIPLIPLDD